MVGLISVMTRWIGRGIWGPPVQSTLDQNTITPSAVSVFDMLYFCCLISVALSSVMTDQ